ncbi:hypothetical protein HER10_EVM0003455 [Colletotrichum scovillei]|uniref:CCHC-type domain-containing protein n=1 Tax=Colletotrichum scovillei TaxID=1209932 RepID=A0A9P7RKF1_9PEZI|nr:uncharacterized protein HER10_EVM0003455 [Colletotrichum scovillei]KAF4777547.1 hypothetical protein HER10_EVM0003455 [Colletotrichum scovillei]KAG7058740.1 zinc finger protein [Colletotrichum scovillei]KAG7077342.1 zinc finger protein [Colletotrichum scovillei]KAG7084405.1 zinc finger protein [Colletotrichum scovillei]
MKRSRPPTSSSGALNYGSDDGQRSRIEEERDSNPAKRPKTNNGPHGTVLMHPHDIRPSKSLVTKYNTPGSESAQMNDKERSVEIQKLKEKLSILEGSSDRECQGTSYSPVRPNLNDSKLGSYSDTQKLEDQHGMHPDRDEQLVRPPSRHRSSSIDRGGWNENRPNHTSSYDRDHRDDTHRDTQRPVTSQSGIQRGGCYQDSSTRSFRGTSSGRYNANRAHHTQQKPQDRTSQDEAKSAPPHAPLGPAANSKASQYLSSGGQKRNKVYHDTDIRRHRPPFHGKVKMTSEEWTQNQITTSQFLYGDRFDPDNICSNCGHAGHWLGDCVFPDDNGTIMGCPIHNTKLHVLDDCPDLPHMSLQQRVTFTVVRRRNKPAIRSRKPWIELVKEAMSQGLEELVWAPSVWTQEFVLRMIHDRKVIQPWLNFDYGRDLVSKLPVDPETQGDLRSLLRKSLLWEQVHRPVRQAR